MPDGYRPTSYSAGQDDPELLRIIQQWSNNPLLPEMNFQHPNIRPEMQQWMQGQGIRPESHPVQTMYDTVRGMTSPGDVGMELAGLLPGIGIPGSMMRWGRRAAGPLNEGYRKLKHLLGMGHDPNSLEGLRESTAPILDHIRKETEGLRNWRQAQDRRRGRMDAEPVSEPDSLGSGRPDTMASRGSPTDDPLGYEEWSKSQDSAPTGYNPRETRSLTQRKMDSQFSDLADGRSEERVREGLGPLLPDRDFDAIKRDMEGYPQYKNRPEVTGDPSGRPPNPDEILGTRETHMPDPDNPRLRKPPSVDEIQEEINGLEHMLQMEDLEPSGQADLIESELRRLYKLLNEVKGDSGIF